MFFFVEVHLLTGRVSYLSGSVFIHIDDPILHHECRRQQRMNIQQGHHFNDLTHHFEKLLRHYPLKKSDIVEIRNSASVLSRQYVFPL